MTIDKYIISTHALTWRATRVACTPTTRHINFYPRPHMEGDVGRCRDCFQYHSISTHALTWRATLKSRPGCPPQSFLPTPSHGGRRHILQDCRDFVNFYPRPHMEGDCHLFKPIPFQCDFYPRPHMEGDPPQNPAVAVPRYFYPRPHMEGDPRHL